MKVYNKIQSIFKRDPENNYRFTDEYSCPEFEYLKNNEWEFTEKVDGTNMRIIWDGQDGLRIAGKTEKASIPTFLYDKLNEIFSAKKFAERFQDSEEGMTLYGEGYGAKIQKGGGNYKSDGVDFVLFDVLIDGWWLKQIDVEKIGFNLGLHMVPVIGTGNLDLAIKLCKEGFSSEWGDFQAEGIVLRIPIGIKNRSGHRIITKVKCKDFN